MGDDATISFEAIVAQVRTTADGGLRIVLDLPEGCILEGAWLMQIKQDQGTVKVQIKR